MVRKRKKVVRRRVVQVKKIDAKKVASTARNVSLAAKAGLLLLDVFEKTTHEQRVEMAKISCRFLLDISLVLMDNKQDSGDK